LGDFKHYFPMSRPSRIEIPGGRYHITARGNDRGLIFRTDRDRLHFLELLAELPSRFGSRVRGSFCAK
jgi:REP element-mobilizing transposase RayT